jgi:hypothetical protein
MQFHDRRDQFAPARRFASPYHVSRAKQAAVHPLYKASEVSAHFKLYRGRPRLRVPAASRRPFPSHLRQHAYTAVPRPVGVAAAAAQLPERGCVGTACRSGAQAGPQLPITNSQQPFSCSKKQLVNLWRKKKATTLAMAKTGRGQETKWEIIDEYHDSQFDWMANPRYGLRT